MLLAQAAIYLVALGGIVFFSFLMLRFAGPALNRTRPRGERLVYGLAALASLAGVAASAAAGFMGVAALLYIAQR
jgi:hypothetical protein